MFKRLFTAAVLFGMAATAPPGQAQVNCADRLSIVATLSLTYNERQVASGLQTGQRLIEIWASPETGSFTVLLTRPDGISCVVASGAHWHHLFPEIQGITG